MHSELYAFSPAVAAAMLVLLGGFAAAQDAAPAAEDAEPAIEPVEVGEIPNLKQRGDTVYFGGQPSEKDLQLLKERGVATIINLRTAPEMEELPYNEAEAAEELGVEYVHVPVTGEGATPEAVVQVRAIIEKSKADERPVLIHCGSGNRVGYVWALVQGMNGVAPEEAIAEGKAAGMRSPALEEDARKRLADDAGEPK